MLNTTDIMILKAIGDCGIFTNTFIPIYKCNTNLTKLIEYGFVSNKGSYILYGRTVNIYMLSNTGKMKYSIEFLKSPYKTDTTQLEHDYCLSKIYSSITPEERISWTTETELKKLYPHANTTDSIFICDNKKIGVEVITPSYSKLEIQNKLEFIKKYCDDSIIIHTNKAIKEG